VLAVADAHRSRDAEVVIECSMDWGGPMAARIEDYALIGDCETAALVSRRGSIEWLCWPRFDSDACFAALLGDDAHGCWSIAPSSGDFRVTRRYLPGTLILETTFETAQGSVQLIDFMPPRGQTSDIVRCVKGLHGQVAMHMKLVLRFGYGAVVPWVTRLDAQRLRAIAGPDMVVLQTPAQVRGEALTSVSEFSVGPGDVVPFVLTHKRSHEPPPDPVDPIQLLGETEVFWREWVARGKFDGPYREIVERSLITLKAMTYAPTGGVVAAATTSLPEHIGGERNWDYRYCWIRDATLTLLTLMDAGYFDEAEAWRQWLQRAVAGAPDQMQIMYGLAGERRLNEWTVDWLPGYEGSRPVRVGNAAHGQLQLDVYGELMDAMHHARSGGLGLDGDAWDLQRQLMTQLARTWDQPDEGLWEVRGRRQRFTHSAVMAWVAVDRAIQAVEGWGFEGPVDEWRRLRERIHAEVWARGYDAQANHFKRAFDDSSLDASLLLMAHVGFLAPDHPAYVGTVEAIERELLVDGYVLRYDTRAGGDGLPPGEGAFLACSFWLADAYALVGRHADAVALFDRLVALANDVGLLAEEFDPRLGRMTGNFPQAFSHIGLIDTAFNLTSLDKPSRQRATSGPPPSAGIVGSSYVKVPNASRPLKSKVGASTRTPSGQG
jgi:GH15 family glucan-1,4-alpha-glucosidase